MHSLPFFTVFLVLYACFVGHSVSVYAETQSNGRSILVFGNSLSAAYRIDQEQGWVALLSRKLVERNLSWQVVNASESGATTLDGLVRIESLLASTKPNIVILELGANDGLRGYPVESIRENLRELIDIIEGSGAEIVLAGMQLPPNWGPKYVDEFKVLYSELAAERELHLIPFFMDGVAAVEGLMQDDGLHPTAAGQPGLLENVWQVLETLLDDSKVTVN